MWISSYPSSIKHDVQFQFCCLSIDNGMQSLKNLAAQGMLCALERWFENIWQKYYGVFFIVPLDSLQTK